MISSYNASADLWYQYFGSSNGSQWLILLFSYGFRAQCATIGLLLNLALVYVTVKSKNLRGFCNILLAMESGFALVLDLSYYVSFLVVISGTKFIRYEHCFWLLIVPCLLGDMAELTMVFTGVDRLCSVTFPIWYKKRNTKSHLKCVWLILFCYAIYDFVINFIDYRNSETIMVSCTTNEMGNGGMGTLMKINGLSLSGTLMVLYSLCWVTVFKFHATAKNANSKNRRLTKSLLLIIALNLFGVFLKSGINLLFQSFVAVNVFVKTSFSIAFSFLTIAVYSANAPVLYMVSKEYRNRFLQHFPCLAQ